MSATVLFMSMSLDGFIAGPNEGPDNGLGDGGHRLHEWLMEDGSVGVAAVRKSGGVNGKIVDEFMSTGAVVAGRGTFEPAGGWGGDHHDGVPIFILARREPTVDSRTCTTGSCVDGPPCIGSSESRTLAHVSGLDSCSTPVVAAGSR